MFIRNLLSALRILSTETERKKLCLLVHRRPESVYFFCVSLLHSAIGYKYTDIYYCILWMCETLNFQVAASHSKSRRFNRRNIHTHTPYTIQTTIFIFGDFSWRPSGTHGANSLEIIFCFFWMSADSSFVREMADYGFTTMIRTKHTDINLWFLIDLSSCASAYKHNVIDVVSELGKRLNSIAHDSMFILHRNRKWWINACSLVDRTEPRQMKK